MHIYIMRHGDAETFAASDAERPLSQMGHESIFESGTALQRQWARRI